MALNLQSFKNKRYYDGNFYSGYSRLKEISVDLKRDDAISVLNSFKLYGAMDSHINCLAVYRRRNKNGAISIKYKYSIYSYNFDIDADDGIYLDSLKQGIIWATDDWSLVNKLKDLLLKFAFGITEEAEIKQISSFLRFYDEQYILEHQPIFSTSRTFVETMFRPTGLPVDSPNHLMIFNNLIEINPMSYLRQPVDMWINCDKQCLELGGNVHIDFYKEISESDKYMEAYSLLMEGMYYAIYPLQDIYKICDYIIINACFEVDKGGNSFNFSICNINIDPVVRDKGYQLDSALFLDMCNDKAQYIAYVAQRAKEWVDEACQRVGNSCKINIIAPTVIDFKEDKIGCYEVLNSIKSRLDIMKATAEELGLDVNDIVAVHPFNVANVYNQENAPQGAHEWHIAPTHLYSWMIA